MRGILFNPFATLCVCARVKFAPYKILNALASIHRVQFEWIEKAARTESQPAKHCVLCAVLKVHGGHQFTNGQQNLHSFYVFYLHLMTTAEQARARKRNNRFFFFVFSLRVNFFYGKFLEKFFCLSFLREKCCNVNGENDMRPKNETVKNPKYVQYSVNGAWTIPASAFTRCSIEANKQKNIHFEIGVKFTRKWKYNNFSHLYAQLRIFEFLKSKLNPMWI